MNKKAGGQKREIKWGEKREMILEKKNRRDKKQQVTRQKKRR